MDRCIAILCFVNAMWWIPRFGETAEHRAQATVLMSETDHRDCFATVPPETPTRVSRPNRASASLLDARNVVDSAESVRQ
jgi:hypothetical protein